MTYPTAQHAQHNSDPMPTSAELDKVVRKIGRRFMWFLVALYFFAIVDRGNVSFAALTMNKTIGLSAQAFGIGVGLMFVTYAAFEVPSNLTLAKIGARATLSRIAILWGGVTMLMACVVGPISFWLLRAALGAAESGLFPGVMLYLSLWFPSAYRGRYNAMFNLAPALGYVASALISGRVLALDGSWGIAGWQWLFLLEGAPAVALGIVGLKFLTNQPQDAHWLSIGERKVLLATLASDRTTHNSVQSHGILRALTNPIVLMMGLCNLLLFCGLTSLQYWLPQIIREFHVPLEKVGLLSAIPPTVGLIGMLIFARWSDRRRNRFIHTAVAFMLSAAGFALIAISTELTAIIIGFVIASVGVFSTQAIFWTIPQSFLHRDISAGTMGAIGMMGSVGGAAMPMVMGHIKEIAHSFSPGFFTVALICMTGAAVVLLLGRLMSTRHTLLTPVRETI
ncbi:MFS transporter [Burkholderia sp. PU8-34]